MSLDRRIELIIYALLTAWSLVGCGRGNARRGESLATR
jgi:hypothetical protein